MSELATVQDIIDLWRPLKLDEQDRAQNLIEVVSDLLREEAHRVGKDLDEMAKSRPSYASVVKSVVVDVVARTLMTSTDQEPMVQTSESSLGYSWSGTFLTPGGGIFIKRDELSRLGLKRQKMGVMEIYDTHQGNDGGLN